MGPNWTPYAILELGGVAGELTTAPLLPDWEQATFYTRRCPARIGTCLVDNP